MIKFESRLAQSPCKIRAFSFGLNFDDEVGCTDENLSKNNLMSNNEQ